MAYVVARPNDRFEIRESMHTPKGPRARSLANFSVLTGDVLAAAAQRATRPFDPVAVVASADRVGAPVRGEARRASVPVTTGGQARRATGPAPRPWSGRGQGDPGAALMELLSYADQVAPFAEPKEPEPLRFPPLARLAAGRGGGGGGGG